MGRLFFFLESALLICALVAVAVVLCLLAPDSPNLSAWVQAVGSIAALFIAIYVMARQNRNAARLMLRQNRHATKLVADADRLATLRRARSVHAVLRRSLNQIDAINAVASSPPPTDAGSLAILNMGLENSVSIADELEQRMAAIPVYDLGAFNMSDGVMQIMEMIVIIRSVVSELQRNPAATGSNHIKAVITRLREIQAEGMEKFESGMQELVRSA
jgi:hypothetical protein